MFREMLLEVNSSCGTCLLCRRSRARFHAHSPFWMSSICHLSSRLLTRSKMHQGKELATLPHSFTAHIGTYLTKCSPTLESSIGLNSDFISLHIHLIFSPFLLTSFVTVLNYKFIDFCKKVCNSLFCL